MTASSNSFTSNLETGICPTLSVCLITFNHESYLDDSLQSVFAQDVDFTMEVVIGEDCSTDGTRQVIARWEARFPNVIRPVLREGNVGLKRNFVDTLSKCRGEFVSVLSGDDYWTDPLKLQKQVNFLRENPSYVLVSGNAVRLRGANVEELDRLNSTFQAFDFDTSFLMKRNPCVASQVTFRNHLISEFPPVYFPSTGEDRGLYLLLSRVGKCRFDPAVSGVYRVHADSITTLRASTPAGRADVRREAIGNARSWDAYFNHEFHSEVVETVHLNSIALLRIAIESHDSRLGADALAGITPRLLGKRYQRVAVRAVQPLAVGLARLFSRSDRHRSGHSRSSPQERDRAEP